MIRSHLSRGRFKAIQQWFSVNMRKTCKTLWDSQKKVVCVYFMSFPLAIAMTIFPKAQTPARFEGGVETALGQPANCTYRLHGSVELNDLFCTPGVVRTTDLWGAEGICSTSTKNYRHTTAEMKKQVCDEYGVTPCPHGGTLEIDHLLPLEIGGADDVKNLWPQQATPKPGFHEKDRLENFVHAEVCSSKMDVAYAQKQMADDWYKMYLDFDCQNFCNEDGIRSAGK